MIFLTFFEYRKLFEEYVGNYDLSIKQRINLPNIFLFSKTKTILCFYNSLILKITEDRPKIDTTFKEINLFKVLKKTILKYLKIKLQKY